MLDSGDLSDLRSDRVIDLAKRPGLMDFEDFAQEFKFDFDRSDIGWNLWRSLSDNVPMLISAVLLEWCGYSMDNKVSKSNAKVNFLEVMDNNRIPYKKLTQSQYAEFRIRYGDTFPEPHRGRGKPPSYILMSPKNFKLAVLNIGTNKSKVIRQYLIELDEVIALYHRYIHEYNRIQSEGEKAVLDAEVCRLRQELTLLRAEVEMTNNLPQQEADQANPIPAENGKQQTGLRSIAESPVCDEQLSAGSEKCSTTSSNWSIWKYIFPRYDVLKKRGIGLVDQPNSSILISRIQEDDIILNKVVDSLSYAGVKAVFSRKSDY